LQKYNFFQINVYIYRENDSKMIKESLCFCIYILYATYIMYIILLWTLSRYIIIIYPLYWIMYNEKRQNKTKHVRKNCFNELMNIFFFNPSNCLRPLYNLCASSEIVRQVWLYGNKNKKCIIYIPRKLIKSLFCDILF